MTVVPPLPFESGGKRGTGALTQQCHNFMIYKDRPETNLLQLFAHT